MYANDCDILILIAIWNFWKSAKKNLNNACLCVCKKESKTQERTQSEAKGPSLSGSGIFSITVTYPLIDDKLY